MSRRHTKELLLIFDEREKFAVNMTVRGPKSLLDRIKKIGEREKVTQNQVKVNLLTTGVDVYEWAADKWGQIKQVRQEGETLSHVLLRLAQLGLETALKQRKP
jgi:hypothetical protein